MGECRVDPVGSGKRPVTESCEHGVGSRRRRL
jgi:hypothetical protein